LTFVCAVNPDAREVYLTGDFCDWVPQAIRMVKRGGCFRTKLALSPGEYQYKFVVDGQWHADPAATAQVPNEFGSMNSVVRVPGHRDGNGGTAR
jgi:1,4-alpha-glucan branching enzyme